MFWLTNLLTCTIIVIIMSTYQRWFFSNAKKNDLVYLDEKGFHITFPICDDTFEIIPQELEFAYCIKIHENPLPQGVVLLRMPFSTRYCFQGELS